MEKTDTNEQHDLSVIIEQTRTALCKAVQESNLHSSILKIMLENMVLQLMLSEAHSPQQQECGETE